MKPTLSSLRIQTFTLVELLVTIAVIAILAGMLLPALNSARGKARGISCLGNQRQLGLLFLQYANAFDDFLPLKKVTTTNASNGTPTEQWAQYFMENEVRISGGGNKPYIYFCPENVVKYKNSDFTYGVRIGGWGDTFEKQVGSGHWTWLKTASGSWDWGTSILNLKRLRKPSGCFFLSDSVRFQTSDNSKPLGSGGYLLNTAVAFTGIWEAHGNAVNMLYADGHVKNNLRTTLKAEWATTDKTKIDRTMILRRKDWLVPDPF
jgi:hypothetical protein